MIYLKWCKIRAVLCVLFSLHYLNCYCATDITSNEINKSVESPPNKSVIIANKPNVTKTEKKAKFKLVCPSISTRAPFFAPQCKSTKDCEFSANLNLVCCNKRCITGVGLAKPEQNHSPLFGMVDRVCPIDPMPEFLPIKECNDDRDCGIRVCCPEKPSQGVEAKNYCRNAAPRFNKMPRVKEMLLPFKNFMNYLQCSPPPPPLLDIFPKVCENPFDCFPNLCCQENGKKFCRPPKKSLLALLATTAQNVGTSEFAKNFIKRIS